MRILDVLARVEAEEKMQFLDLIQQEAVHLPWGTTLILIFGGSDEKFFDELFQLRRMGLEIMLILTGQVAHAKRIISQAEYFKFKCFHFRNEFDLNIWQM